MALVPSMLPGANLPVNECSSCACIREAAAMELPGGFGRAGGALLPWPDLPGPPIRAQRCIHAAARCADSTVFLYMLPAPL